MRLAFHGLVNVRNFIIGVSSNLFIFPFEGFVVHQVTFVLAFLQLLLFSALPNKPNVPNLHVPHQPLIL